MECMERLQRERVECQCECERTKDGHRETDGGEKWRTIEKEIEREKEDRDRREND